MLSGGLPEADALEVAQRVLAGFSEPFQVENLAIEMKASIGVAIAPRHGTDYALLLQHADTAMYVAKVSGSGVSVYDPALHSHDPQRLSMLGDLRRAIDNQELALHYQPKTCLPTNTTCGMEALLRWHHPRRGLTMPGDFIPYAEHTSLIQPLTKWVIEHAIRDMRSWLDEGRELLVSINVSARSLHDFRLCDVIAEKLKRYDVPSRLLVLEITETAFMTEPAKAREVLIALSAMGIELSIDDFGTGHSSLTYLTSLPIHELKIDKSFVMAMGHGTDDAVIVKSVIDLGHNLGLRVVAEGVEDRRTCDLLVEAGCRMAQGYLWSRPIPFDRIGPWIDMLLEPVRPV